jgi:CDGSH-type Zn-finger protein
LTDGLNFVVLTAPRATRHAPHATEDFMKNDDDGLPYGITLDPGTYYRCKCGKSQNLPFCDESHSGSDSSPVEFKVKRRQKVFLCGCGLTGDDPYCDGSCGVSLAGRA